MIKIENLNYNNTFKNLNLEIKEKDFITIIGSSSSGKTTLAKILCGIIPSENIKTTLKKDEIGIVFQDIETNFIYDTVIENIVFPLENLNKSKNEIDQKLKEITSYLQIEDLLELKISSLSGGEKILSAIASTIICEPKLLILDEVFSMLDIIQKEKILKLLKKLNREKKMTIIYLTSDIESAVFGKKIAIIDNQKIIKCDKLKEILNDEKIFKQINQKLPFMADLSLKLKYYNLIDEVILDESKMVDKLWK